MSIGAIDSTMPVRPPMVNRTRKPIANSIGVSKVIAPCHIVASQLKTFTPVGTAISIVAYMKNSTATVGIPTVNMWCAQTTQASSAIATVA